MPSDQGSGALVADDRNSDPAFVSYYERESVSAHSKDRFRVVRNKMLRLWATVAGKESSNLSVLNVGCGAGTECQIWAELGHRVTGIDISEPLIQVARKRAAELGFDIGFDVGSAVELPYALGSFDVCLIPQLLEHVVDWRACLDEGARVLRPGGVLYLSTTNVLCPVQNEFKLPLYSWYPRFLKHRCEKLAVTSHREWVSHTAYPAVHWFTFWQLRDFLGTKGFSCLDRFDLAKDEPTSMLRQTAFWMVRSLPPLRIAAYFVVRGTIVAGVKTRAGGISASA